MDENKPDILSEIFAKTDQPAPPQKRPLFVYPSEEDPLPSSPPSGPPEKDRTGAKLFPWLGVMLGAILLILAVCVLQLVRMNERLDAFQETVSGELGSVEQLRAENESLQASVSLLRERVQKAEAGTESLKEQMQALEEETYHYKIQATALNTLWFVRQFMEARDYPMAALAAQSGNISRNYLSEVGISLSPLIDEQFQQDCQLLTDQGWLTIYSGGSLWLDRFGKFEDQTTADALIELWYVLDSYYCNLSSDENYSIPILYFEQFGGAEYTFLRENCSEFTLQLYQRAVDDLVEQGQLQWEDGRLVQGANYTGVNIAYGIPE